MTLRQSFVPILLLLSQTKTIASTRCGIIANVFSKCGCHQPKTRSMDSLSWDTRIKWSWKKIWVCVSYLSLHFSILKSFYFWFQKVRMKSSQKQWEPHSLPKRRILQHLRFHWSASATRAPNQHSECQSTSRTSCRRTSESNQNPNANWLQIIIFIVLNCVDCSTFGGYGLFWRTAKV